MILIFGFLVLMSILETIVHLVVLLACYCAPLCCDLLCCSGLLCCAAAVLCNVFRPFAVVVVVVVVVLVVLLLALLCSTLVLFCCQNALHSYILFFWCRWYHFAFAALRFFGNT